MTIWFGKIGSLSALPDPARGMTPGPSRRSSDKATIGGGRVVSFTSGPGRRRYDASWNHFTPDQYSIFEEYFHGLRGPGPWVLLDPARRNHLSANQSGATSVDLDPTGFTVDSTEAVTSNPDAYQRGPRSLRWSLPGTVTSGVLTFNPPAGLIGFPAPAAQPWTLSGVLSLAGLVASVSVTPALSWRRIDGSEVSATTGTPISAVPAAWTAFSVAVAAPPAGAVAVVPQLRVTPGVLSTAMVGADPIDTTTPAPYRPSTLQTLSAEPGSRVVVVSRPAVYQPGSVFIERGVVNTVDVLLDQPQLDMANGVRAWVTGTGVPQVSMVDLSPIYDQLYPYASFTAAFVEVG